MIIIIVITLTLVLRWTKASNELKKGGENIT